MNVRPSAHSGPLETRAAGVLLHVTSLPGGRLGRDAFRFVDWLAAAGQHWWQILPLGPPNRLRSPYEAESAFAGWPGLLERPRARVAAAEIEQFAVHHGWAGDWERFAGAGAIADQVRFDREWSALRRYANDRGVRILGDMPLYVAADGADATLHPELFVTTEVAGVPPDYFSEDGQLWGSPLYDWPAMRADGYRWWTERLRRTLEHVDAVRLDHFRGLVAYWAIPAGARTARDGRWRRAPGGAVLDAARTALGAIPLVAEDLGIITPAVHHLRRELGLPGMAVLQFMVDRGSVQEHSLWPQEDRVIYPGTHDNAPVAQWLRGVTPALRKHIDESLGAAGIEGPRSAWSMVQLAHAAPARIAIASAQDLLGLGREGRMNTPGRRHGNWRWRLTPGALTPRLAGRLRELTERSGRLAH
jgi:4-alpha-glucanotransferase